MSLSTTNVSQTVKKQFFFKLKANIDSLSSLLWIQLLAILFHLVESPQCGHPMGRLV